METQLEEFADEAEMADAADPAIGAGTPETAPRDTPFDDDDALDVDPQDGVADDDDELDENDDDAPIEEDI